MAFCDNLLKSFSENLKQLTKMDHFFEIFTETLEQIVTKSHKIFFLDGKEDK